MDISEIHLDLNFDQKWLTGQVHSVLRVVKTIFFCNTVAFLRYLPGEEKLVLEDYLSDSEDILEDVGISLGMGLIGWVGKEQKAILADDFNAKTSALSYYRKVAEVKTVIAVPIVVEDNLIGVLVVDNLEKGAYNWQDKEILIEFSSFISTAVCAQSLKNVIKELLDKSEQ